MMATTYQDAVSVPRGAYSSVSIALHWIIAFMIVGSMTSGILSNYVDEAAAAEIMTTHKPAGLTILALSLIRLGWRLAHPVPQLPPSTPGWNALIARASHAGLYLLMVGVPLAGWVAASRRGGFSYFGLFDVPALPVPESLAVAAADVHAALAIAMLGLVALHIAGALKHHSLNRDDVLLRMLPLPRRVSARRVRAASG